MIARQLALPTRWRQRITIIRTAMRQPTLFNQLKNSL
jgi:hypothetical protein